MSKTTVALHLLFTALITSALPAGPAGAFRVIDLNGVGAGIARWDAKPRSVSGVERSIDGGLRYSISGGDFQTFRDSFSWSGAPPSVAAFQTAVENAFAAWTLVDPATGLDAGFAFVQDLATPAVLDLPVDPGDPLSYLGLNDGAEIDIVATNDSVDYDPGDPGMRGYTVFFIDPDGINDIDLTSEVSGYAGAAIAGADITLNNDPSAAWTLDWFQLILTHEIGHALGLTDVDVFPGTTGLNSAFFDDDYDGSSSATALATLTNPFADLIDPADPDASPALTGYAVPNADPGVDTPGVDILMETVIPSALLGLDDPLSNDDYAAREFLYPGRSAIESVPALDGRGYALVLALLAWVSVVALRARSA